MSLLLDHWRQLKGSVHPLDEDVFRRWRHSFNLEYPPPAYIGDLLNAPIVLLDANGGYNPIITPSEFAQPGAVERYLDLLHNPRAIDPATVAPYYGARNYADLISRGVLVLVNAVAYRSPSITKEPENLKVASLLPSTAVHRKWLLSELLLQAQAGDRFVVAHRTRLWGLRRQGTAPPNVLFTTNPVSADLSWEALGAISAYQQSGTTRRKT